MYEVLFKDKSKRILELLIEKDHSLTEISRALDISKPTLKQSYLNKLVRAGAIEKKIEKTASGRRSVYSLRDLTLHLSIRKDSFLSFSSGLEIDHENFLVNQVDDPRFRDPLIEFLTRLSKEGIKIPHIVLFGSVVKKEATRRSDIDILLLDHDWEGGVKNSILDILSEILVEHHNPIKPVFMDLESFKNGKDRFIKEIRRTGIILYQDDLEDGALWNMMKRYRNISL